MNFFSSLLKLLQLNYHTFCIALCLYPMFYLQYMIFLFSLSDVRLPKLFCFFNLTKHSFYTLLHAVPLKQCDWLYYMNFNAIPILQYLWLFSFHHFHQLVHSLFLRLFQSKFSHIATNYCPIYFPMKIVLCNKAWIFLSNLTGRYLETQAITTFICTCNIKTLTLLFCWFADLPLLGFSLYLPHCVPWTQCPSVGWLICSLIASCSLCALLGMLYILGYACSWK